MENKNTGLKIMVIILCLLVVGLSGYIVYDKVSSNDKESIQDINVNNNSNENILDVGLNLYKFMTGTGTGPFKWSNNECTNYVEVISILTEEYFLSDNDNKGFSIPYIDVEDGKWKSFGGYGTGYQSQFKKISLKEQTINKVVFEITYEYSIMGDTTNNKTEATDIFIMKKIDNKWKVDNFKLIYGLEF